MVKTQLFPSYFQTKALIKCLEGESESNYNSMSNSIWNLRGTPQETVNWQNPDIWIPERLSNEDKKLALKIWNDTNKIVNPRYTRGIMFLIKNYNLLISLNNLFEIAERGKEFISERNIKIIQEIDYEEGCIQILYLLSVLRNAKRNALLTDWKDYLKGHSNYRSDNVIKDSLRRRLANLLERKLVRKEGIKYKISIEGEKYLSKFETVKNSPELSEEINLTRTIELFNKQQKELLKKRLYNLTPNEFENLIKDLLEAMDYSDVVVTSPTNDKGVDVIGAIQIGITMIKEVIQVKKLSSNVQRPILDALRGSLHRFDAFQGTIITLSDFSKGTRDAAFEQGAAPITLINGDKLIDLLSEYSIGIKQKELTYYKFNPDYFSDSDEQIE